MSVGKRVFPKTGHMDFVKLQMKLKCLNFKNLTQPGFWKKSRFGDNAQNRGFFGFWQKNVHCCVDFLFLNNAP